jgi:hypothetical protein
MFVSEKIGVVAMRGANPFVTELVECRKRVVLALTCFVARAREGARRYQIELRAQRRLKRHDIRFQPGLNEDLAAAAVWGNQPAKMSGRISAPRTGPRDAIK